MQWVAGIYRAKGQLQTLFMVWDLQVLWVSGLMCPWLNPKPACAKDS